MSKLDDWFFSKLEEFYKTCEPKASGHPDDVIIYNCEYCCECDCEHWNTYNNKEEK